MNRLATRVLSPALGVMGVMSLVGCSNAEPGRDLNPAHAKTVEISVAGNYREQLILGEVYSQVLQEMGRSTNMSFRDAPGGLTRMEELRVGQTDLVIGCTGMFLHAMDPLRAAELSEGIKAGEFEDPLDQTYQEFLGALPGSATSPDPSSAQGCAAEARAKQVPELPQSIVPVYDRELLNRSEVEEINNVTRLLTTADLENLIEAAEEESSTSQAVADWLGYSRG